MNAPLLTIVTITKDDPRGLARTLQSTAAWRVQSGIQQIVVYSGDEVSFVDDGSLSVQRQTSTGIAGAFNEGLAGASGEWIWFLNGGDAIHETLNPIWLMALLSATKAQVVTGALHFDGESTPRNMPHLSYQWPMIACWMAHPATFVRRTALLQIGGFETRWRLAMDYDLWWRLMRRRMAVDVISVPFARFDRTGISERSEMRAIARYEEMVVVLNYAPQLAFSAAWICLRSFRRIVNAMLQWMWLTVVLTFERRKFLR